MMKLFQGKISDVKNWIRDRSNGKDERTSCCDSKDPLKYL